MGCFHNQRARATPQLRVCVIRCVSDSSYIYSSGQTYTLLLYDKIEMNNNCETAVNIGFNAGKINDRLVLDITLHAVYNQEHIEPRSGEGACNSAYCPYIRRNSNMADGTLK